MQEKLKDIFKMKGVGEEKPAVNPHSPGVLPRFLTKLCCGA